MKIGDIGANQNRFSYAAANMATTVENITVADSVIRDTDMAAEMTALSKNQILIQPVRPCWPRPTQRPNSYCLFFK